MEPCQDCRTVSHQVYGHASLPRRLVEDASVVDQDVNPTKGLHSLLEGSFKVQRNTTGKLLARGPLGPLDPSWNSSLWVSGSNPEPKCFCVEQQLCKEVGADQSHLIYLRQKLQMSRDGLFVCHRYTTTPLVKVCLLQVAHIKEWPALMVPCSHPPTVSIPPPQTDWLACKIKSGKETEAPPAQQSNRGKEGAKKHTHVWRRRRFECPCWQGQRSLSTHWSGSDHWRSSLDYFPAVFSHWEKGHEWISMVKLTWEMTWKKISI